MSIYDEGARFEVVCKRCGERFWVIRNWGGGIRREDNENCNPAICHCGSRRLELW
jgi:DNA-directed RNA polymerase subunit RPC12/RpoP